jgi:hypothetical protein
MGRASEPSGYGVLRFATEFLLALHHLICVSININD